MRINHHQDNEHKEEHNRADNGEAIKVLLDNARTHLAGHGALDDLANARALSGVEHDERDNANAGNDEQDKQDDKQRTQGNSLLSS